MTYKYPRFICLVWILAAGISGQAYGLAEDTILTREDVFSLSMEELDALKLPDTGSLTKPSVRWAPSEITVITSDMIQRSGARRLEEVLSIYVPSMTWLKHPALTTRLGMRSVMSDLNDKLLLMVNGHVMNQRTILGVESELGLSMLGDIERIEVLNGPASATYGPGALAGVINIRTFNGGTHSGTRVFARAGAVEAFQMAEVSTSHVIDENKHFYMYYGTDHYPGAKQEDAPLKSSLSYNTPNGTPVIAHEPISFDIPNDQQAYHGQARQKLHLQYDQGAWSTWLRFTEGGTHSEAVSDTTYKNSLNHDIARHYQQFSLESSYKWQPDLKVSHVLTYGMDSMAMGRELQFIDQSEKKQQLKWLSNYDGAVHKAAGTVEFYREAYQNSKGSLAASNPEDAWTTYVYSAAAEDQWLLSEAWRVFGSLRLDKHSYTRTLTSPRLAFIHSNEKSTQKLSLSRSNRINSAYEMRAQKLASNTISGDEQMDVAEVHYDYKFLPSTTIGANVYRSQLDLISYNFASGKSEPTGVMDLWGADIVLRFHKEPFNVVLSHSYQKLIDFRLASPAIFSALSAEPYGYGNDLQDIPNHLTKLVIDDQLTDHLGWHLNVQHIWRYEGAADFAAYNDAVFKNQRLTKTDGNNEAFSGSTFVSTSGIWTFDETLSAQLTLHNVLGWFSDDYNKRNVQSRMGLYRVEAPAVSVGVEKRL